MKLGHVAAGQGGRWFNSTHTQHINLPVLACCDMGIEMYDDGINALFIGRARKAKRMVFFPQCGNSLFGRFVGLLCCCVQHLFVVL